MQISFLNWRHLPRYVLIGFFAFALQFSPALADEPTKEDLDFFEKEIRPLLIKHCHECHSAQGKQEGELRLDGRAVLLHGGASGPSAVAGKPKESLLVEAIQYRSLEMPPNGKLPDAEIAKLVRWVEMGLPWPKEDEDGGKPTPKGRVFDITPEQREHWAFQPVLKPTIPAVENPDWNQTAIDRFVFAKRANQGIQPNGLADRGTLLRRVTYDLTGLPPTPEERNAFLNDDRPDAWSRVVERLLASPQYGERWGRHWLDVVRYADTAGDASDYPVPDAYKYRDYVIRSFNNDKPYDQFLREQYAGDLLAKDAPPEQFSELTTATTLLAMSRRFGYNDTNFYYFHLTIADLLDTMGQSVLGLSIGCARCHDHKFEPISAKDYYALYGIFESTTFTFPGAEEVQRPKELIPLIPRDEAEKKDAERKQRLAEFDRIILEKSMPILSFEGAFEEMKSLPAPWKADTTVHLVPNHQSTFTNVFPMGNQVIELPNVSNNFGFRRPTQSHHRDTKETLYINLDFKNVSVDAGGDGYYRISLDNSSNYSPSVEIFINGTSLAVRDGDALRELAPVEIGVWHNLQFAVNWQSQTFSGVLSNGQKTWNFADIPLNPKWDGTANSFVIDAHGTDSSKVRPLRQIDNLAIQYSPFRAAGEKTELTAEAMKEEIKQVRDGLGEIQKQKDTFAKEASYATVYAVREGKVANTRLQFRGEPERLGEEVPRGFLEILGGEKLPADCGESGRRQLADWLTSPTNPLTARVMANRVWQYHFGRGIVPTPNDFGVRGEAPSHPELLDYLAMQFQENGWSVKALHREILQSRAYQLASTMNDEAYLTDPGNQWLWRYSRRRLDAESIRDSLLFISKELDLTPGGAHPFPAVESWRFSQHNPFDAVYASNKRSVYLMTQRIKRHPFLALFDGADPNATTAQRVATTTPLQALFLMNDAFTHERTQAAAKRMLAERPTDRERIQFLYEAAYSRSPTPEEINDLEAFLKSYSERLAGNPDREVQSWAASLRVILSSNEFLYVD
ncbi:DUF1553 domain-containing protein [Planctomicrobium sp. SH527]|uniref:DUF1553 domain-containing protein n=1 Tax=Planctomicrobium sp. SH527 TaxID=3448123 RepID=UPI003F5C7189